MTPSCLAWYYGRLLTLLDQAANSWTLRAPESIQRQPRSLERTKTSSFMMLFSKRSCVLFALVQWLVCIFVYTRTESSLVFPLVPPQVPQS
jgi:hypothetical protein